MLPDNEISPFEGQVLLQRESNREALIIKIVEAFNYDNSVFEYLLAFPRNQNDSFSNLLQGKSIFCSIIRIPYEQIDSDAPFDISWWRGGGAFLGDIELL